MIKVLALQRQSLVANAPSLSVSIRVIEVLDYLSKKGELHYAAIVDSDPKAKQAIDWADAVILSKHNSEIALDLTRYAIECKKCIIYDIDDWIFSFPEYSGGRRYASNLEFIRSIINLATVVTVSNETLMREVRAYCEHPVFLPNGMATDQYSLSVHDPAEPPRIVFTNADFLKMVKGKDAFMRALHVFFHHHPEYMLDFYGDPFPEMVSLPFLHFTNRLSYSDYLESLNAGRYQFAIVPLGSIEDKESLFFNRCKNPFKYLNYAALRIPGIYSSSPIYEQCITHKETGFLVENTYESWINAMETMTSDAALRKLIAENALHDVATLYHIRFSADVLINTLMQHINC